MFKIANLYTDVKSTGNMGTSESLNPGLKKQNILETKIIGGA